MKIYQSSLLKRFPNLLHAFTSREDGVSKSPYSSLNLAFHVNDNPQDVESNHELLAKRLNYKKETLVHMNQIHSDIVHIVDENDNFSNPSECDALVTNKKNIPLMVMVADCSPVLFYDDKQKVIALAHAGRQGAFKNIVKNTIETMKHKFDSNAEDIYVSIGASIGVCCYELGSEIYDEEFQYAFEIRDNRYYLDVNKILKEQLLESGIKYENLEVSPECTCCQNKKYFSYRADGITGRFAGILKLN